MTGEELTSNSAICAKEWRFLPEFGNEKQAMQLAAAAISQRLCQSRLEDLQTVLAEACINAIEYGDGSSPIIVRVNQYIDRLDIHVINVSEKEPELPQAATAAEIWQKECPRGWGLLFIRQLADQFQFGHCSEGFYIKVTYFVEGRSV